MSARCLYLRFYILCYLCHYGKFALDVLQERFVVCLRNHRVQTRLKMIDVAVCLCYSTLGVRVPNGWGSFVYVFGQVMPVEGGALLCASLSRSLAPSANRETTRRQKTRKTTLTGLSSRSSADTAMDRPFIVKRADVTPCKVRFY